MWLALSLGQAGAHPLDSYATDQYVDILMASGEVSLVHRIEFAEIPTIAEMPKVDTDSDTTLSKEETNHYLENVQKVLSHDLDLSCQGQPTVLSYERGEVLLQEIPAPRLKVITSHKGRLQTIPPAGATLQFDLKHRAGARGDRQIRLFCSGFQKLESVWSSDPRQPLGMAPPVVNEATALVYGHTTRWVLMPSLIEHKTSPVSLPASRRELPLQPPDPFLNLNPRGFAVSNISNPLQQESPPSSLSHAAAPQYSAGETSKPNRETWADSQFRGLFAKAHERGLGFLLFATLLSLIYGAAHAMEPGHGKTIVAAYLTGTHGTVFHAVVLALIVTFTHTFSVYILGMIALTNIEKVQGTYLPWLECGSWALIVFMGLALFLKYYRAYVLGRLADPTYHTHVLGGGHSHLPHLHGDHGHLHEHEHEHMAHLEDEDHPHGEQDHDGHSHHSHDHFHPHFHEHSHEHPHVSAPECLISQTAKTDSAGQVSYWNLLTLGVTGGIVPCPGALFVMMMALTSGQALVGLYLITIFSTGLALALMTVGIVMVRSRHWLDRYSPNGQIIQILPVLSSVVIILAGAAFLLNGLVRHGIVEIHLS